MQQRTFLRILSKPLGNQRGFSALSTFTDIMNKSMREGVNVGVEGCELMAFCVVV